MSKPIVAVVILNYNGQAFLEKFLPTVIKYSSNHAIYVADNGSTDESVLFLKDYYPNIKIIDNGGNFGYAKGYNLALKKIKADYFILLNSDVEVTENWINPIITLMESDTKIAACQPKLLDYNNRTHFEYAGASGGFLDKYGYPFCRGRLFNVLENDTNQFDNKLEVFWATGACLFIKSSYFFQAGGFDDDYFAHMEEIDLCWRLKNLGYKIVVQPQSIVYHVGGGTLHKLSSKKTFLNFRNNLSTLFKNHPSKNLFFIVFYRLILDGIAALKFLLDGQPKHFFAVIKAHFNFYIWLPSLLSKRKNIQKMKGFMYSKSQIYQRNIVVEHFIKKKNKFSDLDTSLFS